MGWSKVADKNGTRYSTFLSDIEAYRQKTKKYIRCPKCRKYLIKHNLCTKPVRVGEEPEAVFRSEHRCGAVLIVFND